MSTRPFSLSPIFLLLSLVIPAAATATTPLDPSWYVESDQSSANLGYAVSATGDLNGDGYNDILVGSIKYTADAYKGGAVFAYYGGRSGPGATPDWTLGCDQSGAELGTAVSIAGDLNGDGYDDAAVSAPRYNTGQTRAGRVYIFYGSATGLSAAPDLTLDGDQSEAAFGVSLAGAGDVNGDGYDDLLVGAKWHSDQAENEGGAFLFYGGADGIEAAPGWARFGGQANAALGAAVAGAGDVNDDGYGDVLLGAPRYDLGDPAWADAGAVYLYAGGATGPAPVPLWQKTGPEADAAFGAALAGGDVNGDRRADLLIGAPGQDGESTLDAGAAYLFLGQPDGVGGDPHWSVAADQSFSHYGAALAIADVNNDGWGDLLVGASQYTQDQSREGVAFVYLGHAVAPTPAPVWTAAGDKAETGFGAALSGGDVNRDGYADLLVGAPTFRNQTDIRGRAFLYNGRSYPVATTTLYLPLIQR